MTDSVPLKQIYEDTKERPNVLPVDVHTQPHISREPVHEHIDNNSQYFDSQQSYGNGNGHQIQQHTQSPQMYGNPPYISYDQSGTNTFFSTMYITPNIQLSILLSILYFIFQLPIITNLLSSAGLDDICLNEDGGMTTYGFIVKSILFGTTFYGIHTFLSSPH